MVSQLFQIWAKLLAQFYLYLAPEQLHTPTWILNFSIGEDCLWQHVPTTLIPAACVPLEAREHQRSPCLLPEQYTVHFCQVPEFIVKD